MAITLNIELTDQEQARLLDIAAVVAPGATPAQVKTWAERKAKQGLRAIVVMEWNDHQTNKLEQDWPMDQEYLPVNDPQNPPT